MAAFLIASVPVGILLRRCRGRWVCLILSGILCLAFPIATALGMVTLVVLT